MFKRGRAGYGSRPCPSFNLLSEILFVQARRGYQRWRYHKSGFNLLSEILFVQATSSSTSASNAPTFQSLERDSVCSSITKKLRPARLVRRFNLLSEILFVQASVPWHQNNEKGRFQSLERDSVCSSAGVLSAGGVKMGVSIS